MINKNELRIGNYVNGELYETGCSVTVRQYKIKSLGEKIAVIQDRKTQSVLSYQDIQPIPLTSEWLLKFGFKVQSITWHDGSVTHGAYVKNDYYIEENDYPGEFFICKIDNGFPGYRNVLIRTVQYVDQLQNAFYFLTGEELTIQE